MFLIEVLFWFCLFVVFYAFIGYGIILYALTTFKRSFRPVSNLQDPVYAPHVSLVIPCYNEAHILLEKVLNYKQLAYPDALLKVYFITDGSTDHFRQVLKNFPDLTLLHEIGEEGRLRPKTAQ